MPPKRKKGGAMKKTSLYKKPPPISPGEKLRDTNGRSWIIGPSIGVGGFGEIYSACEFLEGTCEKSDYLYVVKIEPIENGPLFVECNFYKRNYNDDDIADFMDSRRLSQLGMPVYLGTGEHWLQVGNKKTHLRFLILERYGTDINKKFIECGRFPAPTVFLLGLQVLDVLEYVHSRSYIHADIKGANILLGIQPGTEHQAYLLDFGLAWRVVGENYKPDPKCAHEGTLEYTSTDRHIGAQTMRGDLEILAYNMLQWLTGSLPWEGIENPNTVHKMKVQLVENVRDRIQKDYPHVPDHLLNFFEYINTLDMPDVPDHASCRRIFESYLTSVGKTRQSELEFPLLARNNITNINVATSDLTIQLNDVQINLTKTKYTVSQGKGDKNLRETIQRRSYKKPSMDSGNSNKLELNTFKPKSIKGRSPKTNSTESTDEDSEELVLSKNKMTKETAIQKAKFELDEDFTYALKLDKELNNESVGGSNNQRPRRTPKPVDRYGITNTPAEITPKPCNNPVKKLKKKNRPLIPSSKANVTKDIDTPKNNNKTIELNNEIENKELNKRIETNKIKTLSCSESEISIIDLDSTNELSNENFIENNELTSPEGKKTKLIVPKKSLAVAQFPKRTKIKKSTSLKIPEAKQQYLKNKKVDEVEVESESENDDLDGLPKVSWTSSHSKNSSLRDDSIESSSAPKNKILNKHMDKIEKEIEENHDIEVLRNNDYTSKKSKFSDPKGEPNTKREHVMPIYDEHVVESSTDIVSAQSVHVDDQNITKTKEGKQAKRHNISEILSSMQNSEDEKLFGNNHEREVVNIKSFKQKNHTADVQVSSINITKNCVIKNQEDQQVSEKCKNNNKDRVVETISQTQANNVMNQDDDEPKSKKNKINELIDTCTTESRDIDASQEKYKESRYEWDNTFQPKLKKKNKNKNASSETSSNTVKSVNADVCRAKQRNRHSEPDILSTIKNSENDTLVGVNNESYKLNNTSELISSTDDIIENSVIEDKANKRKHKKLTDKMSVTEMNNKSDLEKVDGEFKSKKKKINKSIESDICTSEIEDTDGVSATKSSDFSSDVKQSECKGDDFQPKPDKNKKKYKLSHAYNKKKHKKLTDKMSVAETNNKPDLETFDGEFKSKKKKINKSIESDICTSEIEDTDGFRATKSSDFSSDVKQSECKDDDFQPKPDKNKKKYKLSHAYNKKKHKELTDKMSVTETNNKSDLEMVDGEFKSKKKKINKSIESDICTSEIEDTDGFRATKSSDFSSDVKQSECKDDDFQPKPDKNKKKYKLSHAYNKKKHKELTDKMSVTETNNKSDLEMVDGEFKSKKKKTNKSIESDICTSEIEDTDGVSATKSSDFSSDVKQSECKGDDFQPKPDKNKKKYKSSHAYNKKKHKKLTDKMSVTETNNKSDLETVDGEFKSKKKKINKSIESDICTSEIEDTDGFSATKSSDFSSDVKQSECKDDDFQPKPDKYKKKHKSSHAYTSKSVDANSIPSPVSIDDAKDNREKEDGEPQAKKKKKDKPSYSSAYDSINAYYCTRRNSSNFGKDSKTTAKKVSEHTKQPELTDVPKTETTNDITKIKKKKKKTKAREDSGSDGDFDNKHKSIPANKNRK